MSEKRFIVDDDGIYDNQEKKHFKFIAYDWMECDIYECCEKLNEQQEHITHLEDTNDNFRIKLIEDIEAMEQAEKKIGEQQATIDKLRVDIRATRTTIRKLQDLCGESDGENAKLRIENKKLKEENEKFIRKKCLPCELVNLQTREIDKLKDENEQLRQELNGKDCRKCGNYCRDKALDYCLVDEREPVYFSPFEWDYKAVAEKCKYYY